MRIIFAGTPDFATPALAALIAAGHQIVMVLTQPDRPAGRGMQLKASPVKQLAAQHGLNVYQPSSLKPLEVQNAIAATQADAMVVAAYGLIIPSTILAMPALGCYNIHASLLPRWRGAAPIHRALLAGDAETGVTIMAVVPALDAGDMLAKASIPIKATDTTHSLHEALRQIGATLMVETLQQLAMNDALTAIPQDENLVTYAHKLEKAEAIIDWQKSAIDISRQVRAFNPFPVANAQFRGQTCRIWFATALTAPNTIQDEFASRLPVKAGQIIGLTEGLEVACGSGVLSIESLQLPGAKQQSAAQFIQGQHLLLGECFH